MPIVAVRIDDRLIHGQIVQGWLKNIDIDKIVVASDTVVSDSMQVMLMSMAVPSNVEFEIKKVDDVADAIISGDYDQKKVMVLVSNPKDIVEMMEKGAVIKSVNVGGMHFVHGKKQLLCNLSIDDEDVKNLYTIHLKGAELEGRVLPLDERVNIVPIIEKEYQNITKAKK